MKINLLKKLCILCIFANCSLFGQTTYTGLKKDYTQSMDSLLTYVNKTPITTGILYDRVMAFSSLNMLKENGIITKSNYQHFIQSWSELNRSAYSPTFLDVENLKTSIQNNANTSVVDIGIINTKMNYIDYGTPTIPSLNFTNGYFSNVAGINPFLEKQITVIAPLKEKVTSGTVTFRLLSSFLLQLTGLPIKNLAADFGTGTNYNLITNQVISTTSPTITYTTSGKKECTFTVTFSDNTTETLKATLEIQLPSAEIIMNSAVMSFPLEQDFVGSNGITASTTGNIAFQGYNESTPSKGVLEYRTYYNLATNNGSAVSKINKPIIILDGYDPGDGRKIYQQSIGYNQDKKSLYELMYYDPDNNVQTNNNENLVNILRSSSYGFDVTLVNFPNGTDYVERNAMALVALLQRENTKLTANGSTEKITIIGPSMGGLVSRYALAYMEKNNIPHNTKLWVSFDSPHLGANIPIGAQENLYFYGYNGRQDAAKIKFDENFRSPAARQMLIEQLDGLHEATPYPSTLWSNSINGQNNNTPFRQQFQSNLNSNGLSGSNGFPQNLRKIALINGTTNGTKTNNAGNKFLELAAFTIIKYGQIFGTPIQTKIKVATINDSFLTSPFSTGQTFSGKVTIKRVGGIEVHNGSVTRTNNNPRGSMDVVQGGTFNTQGIIKDEFTLALNDAVDSQEWRTYLPNHAFIPSVSSLAFKNPNFDWSTAINRNLVCDPLNKEIYFDTYFAPSTNQEHVFVSADNVKWLIKELQGIPQAPNFPIQDGSLTGPATVCKNTNATFTISDICKVPSPVIFTNQNGNSINGWSVQGNLAIVSSTPYSVTVQATTNTGGDGKVIATFQNGQTLEKTVHIGSPIFPVIGSPIFPVNGYVSGATNTTFNQTLTYSYVGGSPIGGSTNYQWFIDAPINDNGGSTCNWQILSGQGTSSITVKSGCIATTAVVGLRSTNNCGSSMKYTYVTVSQGGGGNPCEPTLTIYPNPISSNNNLEMNVIYPPDPCDGNNPNARTSINNEVKIYDFFGNIVFSNLYDTDKITINNLNLKRGYYVLNVFTKQGRSRREIIIVE